MAVEQKRDQDSAINSWFGNDRYPVIDDAQKMANTLDASLDYLATGNEPSRRFEDPIIAEIIDYLEGLRPTELQQACGIIKLAKATRLSDDPLARRTPATSQERAA